MLVLYYGGVPIQDIKVQSIESLGAVFYLGLGSLEVPKIKICSEVSYTVTV